VIWAVRLMLAGTVIAPAVEMPNLSGEWQLNKDQSDDPEKVMTDARSSGGGSSGGGMGHGGGRLGGGGGWGGGGGRGGRSDSGDSGSGGAGGWFVALDTLQIKHAEPTVSITDAAGRERVLYTDGRKTEEERSHGGTTAVTASWKDGHLEVVSKPETGGKITETYAVAADRSQLVVTTKVDGSRGGSFTIRRVYDAAAAGAPKPTPPARRAPATPPPTEDEGVDQSV
jgi:hypothetical protein